MPLSNTFDSLSHALRRLSEDAIRFGELVRIDPDEAIGNYEEALDGVLNKIHGMHDIAKMHAMNWHKTPEIAVMLKVRNERQHGGRKDFQTAYQYIVKNAVLTRRHGYTCIDFPTEGTTPVPLYITLHSFSAIVQRSRPKHEEETAQIIGYTCVKAWETRSAEIAFFDYFPLITNAMISIVACGKPYIKPLSVESSTFLSHFQMASAYDLSNFTVTEYAADLA